MDSGCARGFPNVPARDGVRVERSLSPRTDRVEDRQQQAPTLGEVGCCPQLRQALDEPARLGDRVGLRDHQLARSNSYWALCRS